MAISSKDTMGWPKTPTDKLLKTLVLYSVLTIPFVQWPGSVIGAGIPTFIKGVVFYYFTIAFVRTEADLKWFLVVFVGCQLFRVLEPLYLHITDGYWGSIASMANWEYLNRLSGAPSDVVNPNGLAFIICSVLPFMYLMAGASWKGRVGAIVLTGLCIYTLTLTGSRSGIIGVGVIFFGILAKSQRKSAWLVCGAVIVILGFPMLPPDMQDRYLSTIGMGVKNADTAEARVTGVLDNFVVALRRPIFGHGLGTSREANANFGEEDQPAHNLYAEVAQELGFIGLVIVLQLLRSIYQGFMECKRTYQSSNASVFMRNTVDCMQVTLLMNFIFSFASYGLNSYEWYLLGGLSVVMQQLAINYSENNLLPGVSRD